MSSKKSILLTGGTGFLGKKILPLLREKFEVDVLSRSGKTEITGDLSQWDAGIDFKTFKLKKYDIFLNLAGLYDLTASKADCYQHNVAAMGIALKLAQKLEIPYFLSTSTVAAAINTKLDSVNPYDLEVESNFPDSYSESKAFGEQILKNWSSEQIKARINLRLGVLIGDTNIGEIERVDGIYHAVDSLRKVRMILEKSPKLIFFPGNEKVHIPLVPVDICAQAIVKYCEWVIDTNPEGYQSYHLTPNTGLNVKELYASALSSLGLRDRNIILVDEVPQELLKKVSKVLARLPEEELTYLMSFPKYESQKTAKILGDNWCPEFHQYENIIWRGYAAYISNRRN